MVEIEEDARGGSTWDSFLTWCSKQFFHYFPYGRRYRAWVILVILVLYCANSFVPGFIDRPKGLLSIMNNTVNVLFAIAASLTFLAHGIIIMNNLLQELKTPERVLSETKKTVAQNVEKDFIPPSDNVTGEASLARALETFIQCEQQENEEMISHIKMTRAHIGEMSTENKEMISHIKMTRAHINEMSTQIRQLTSDMDRVEERIQQGKNVET